MGKYSKISKKRSRKSKTGKSKGSSSYKKRVSVVPGYTRVNGAYGRAIPCGPEKKFVDVSQTGGNMLGTGGTFVAASNPVVAPSAAAPSGPNGAYFCLIPQNTTDNTRIGNKICVTNFNFKGSVALNTKVSALAHRVRYIFGWDLQANGAQIVASDILKYYTATPAGELMNAFRNLDQVERFKIIKDKIVVLNPLATNAGTITQHEVPFKCSWRGDMPVHYSSTAGAITELRSANLFLLIFSDGGDTDVAWSGIGRVKFTDL